MKNQHFNNFGAKIQILLVEITVKNQHFQQFWHKKLRQFCIDFQTLCLRLSQVLTSIVSKAQNPVSATNNDVVFVMVKAAVVAKQESSSHH